MVITETTQFNQSFKRFPMTSCCEQNYFCNLFVYFSNHCCGRRNKRLHQHLETCSGQVELQQVNLKLLFVDNPSKSHLIRIFYLESYKFSTKARTFILISILLYLRIN